MKFVSVNLASAVVLSVCALAGRTDESGRPFASLGKKLALMQEDGGLPEECTNAIEEFIDASENINEECDVSFSSGPGAGGPGFGGGFGGGFGRNFGGGFMSKVQSSFNGGFNYGGFNYTDEEIEEGCNEFNEFCAEDLETLGAASAGLLESCRALGNSTVSRETFQNFPIQEFLQAQSSIGLGLIGQVACLEVDGELCTVTIRDASEEALANAEGLDCNSQFRPGGNCTEECRAIAEAFIDEAGCCFSAFSSVSFVTDGRLGQWESGNERVAIDLTVCDIDLELCNEGVELLDNVGAGLSGDSTGIDGNSGSGNGESGNAGSALNVDQSLVALMVSSAAWVVAQDIAAQA